MQQSMEIDDQLSQAGRGDPLTGKYLKPQSELQKIHTCLDGSLNLSVSDKFKASCLVLQGPCLVIMF